ncbi:MAG: amidohydrolase family protein [Chitinophagaceae bacterium]
MRIFLIVVFFLPLFSKAQNVLIKNVTVVDVQKGAIIPKQNVLVTGNRITKISSQTITSTIATIVNGTGKYLMPGLCDFNAYVLQYENEGVPAFKLMLANGVTSVRDLLPPNSLAEVREIKQKIATGKLLAPRLYLSGKTLVDKLPFQKQNENKSYLVKSPSEAVKAVDSMIYWGADVIDMRTILNEPILRAITNRAHQKGIKVMARYSGNWMTASDNGIDAFTHLSDLWRVTSKGREKIFKFSAEDSMRYVLIPDFYNRVLPSLGAMDTPYFYSLTHTLKKNKTWLCSGITSFGPSQKWFEHGDTSRNVFRTERQKQLMRENLKFASQLTYSNYKSEKPIVSFIIMAVQSGVPLLAGTQMEEFITPGMSLHDMLYWVVDAGLTPPEALRTATINPAVFLNKQKQLGTVEVGKLADLVLLDANPLADISNTRKINAVVANGRLLQRKDLDELLEEAKIKVKQ